MGKSGKKKVDMGVGRKKKKKDLFFPAETFNCRCVIPKEIEFSDKYPDMGMDKIDEQQQLEIENSQTAIRFLIGGLVLNLALTLIIISILMSIAIPLPK